MQVKFELVIYDESLDKFEIDDISVEMDKLQDIYFNTFEKIIHKED